MLIFIFIFMLISVFIYLYKFTYIGILKVQKEISSIYVLNLNNLKKIACGLTL